MQHKSYVCPAWQQENWHFSENCLTSFEMGQLVTQTIVPDVVPEISQQ